MNNKIKTIASTALLGLMSFSGNATAQESQVGVSGWFKSCNENDGTKICNVQFRIAANGGQIVTVLNLIETSGKVSRKIFQIIVPTSRSLPPGVQVKVDGKQAVAIPYTFCRPQICVAEAGLNNDLVKVFKSGGGLEITSINLQGTPNPVPVTLSGFTAAYDGPPVAPQEAAETSQEKLKRQLEEKLKAGEIKAE